MSFTEDTNAIEKGSNFDENALDFDIVEILRSEREKNGVVEVAKWNAGSRSEVLDRGSYPKHDGIGPFNEVNLPGVWFYKMPHKVWSL